IVSDIKDMPRLLREHNIEIVILAVPAIVAQYIVDEVVAAGIKAILNFAPINLKVPEHVYLRTENMAMELEYLSFAISNNYKPD
ncbi:MAG: redox-sensing transcriptional repressor Rex, partial [Candidatus Zixiibacteriota bacterium]